MKSGEVMENKLANKQDIRDVRQDILSKKKLDQTVTQAKSDLTIRMGTMLAASIAILTAIHKII